MTHPLSRPRALVEAWIVVLLAPTAWAAALGILFSLTDEACARGARTAMVAVACACVALTLAPGLLAWAWRRRIAEPHAAADRARFMLAVAIGASAIFTLVLMMTTVPIFLLPACRT
jgi:hypothetical protein